VSSLARSRLISAYSIDVARNATLGAGLNLPHPLGIVIGEGVRVGRNVTVYQNVTLGAARGAYPMIGDDVLIYPGAVVVGGIQIGNGAVIGANCFVAADVQSGERVSGGTSRP
jgi:serine O-acetyltransferase